MPRINTDSKAQKLTRIHKHRYTDTHAQVNKMLALHFVMTSSGHQRRDEGTNYEMLYANRDGAS